MPISECHCDPIRILQLHLLQQNCNNRSYQVDSKDSINDLISHCHTITDRWKNWLPTA